MNFSQDIRTTHKGEPSITRWDLFACVAGRPEGIALARLAHILRVERERSLILPLGSLEDEGLIVCDSHDHYILSTKPVAQQLRYTMAYALAYEYDYNAYFDDNAVNFLKKAYRSDYFTDRDVPAELMNPTLLSRLVHNDLLLIYKYNSFTGRIVENPFLDGICDYLKIKRGGGGLFSVFRKKIPLESVLNGREAAIADPDDAQMQAARTMFCGRGLGEMNWGLTETGAAIRDSVQKEDSEMFDPESSECFDRAWEKMHENTSQAQPLSVDSIRAYHSLCMANTDFAGVYRTHDVMIANNPNFKAADIKDIPFRLGALIDYLAAMRPDNFEEALGLCAYAYNEFIHIHPFEDGNSRTARVVMAHMLNLFKMPFEKIPHSFEVRFLVATKGLKTRDDNEVKYILEEIYLNSVNRKELAAVLHEPGNTGA